MSVASDLLALVPTALDIVRLLHAGDEAKAERKARVLAETIALKRATRAAAKAGKRTK
jgi:hypothetical protein